MVKGRIWVFVVFVMTATLGRVQERFVPVNPTSFARFPTCWRARPGCSPCWGSCSPGATGPGPELAERLGVTDRTVRKDVDRLRLLGYPVDAVRGPHGRYRLGVGASLPPLLLDEDEAVAVAVGLRAATGITGHRGDQRAGARQARLRAPAPPAAPGLGDARGRPQGAGEHRFQRRGPRRRRGAAHGPGRGDPRPRGGPVRLPGRGADGPPAGRAVPAGVVAAALVPRGPRRAYRHVGALPRGLADA